MLNATRDLLPYFAYLIAMVAWAKTVLDPQYAAVLHAWDLGRILSHVPRTHPRHLDEASCANHLRRDGTADTWNVRGEQSAGVQQGVHSIFGCGLVWPVRNQDRRH